MKIRNGFFRETLRKGRAGRGPSIAVETRTPLKKSANQRVREESDADSVSSLFPSRSVSFYHEQNFSTVVRKNMDQKKNTLFNAP